jgi:hypothetical protein
MHPLKLWRHAEGYTRFLCRYKPENNSICLYDIYNLNWYKWLKVIRILCTGESSHIHTLGRIDGYLNF